MRDVVKLMLYLWDMDNTDWMGYTLQKDEKFSYHHLIIPKREGGPASIDNGAILIQSAGHDYLHMIEKCDRELFEYITKILVEVNRQQSMPTKEQLIRISNILKSFEREYQGKRTPKGKLIIKERYLNRLY